MKRDLSEFTVVITGASRGIGRALAEDLAGRGARIGCIARSASDLEDLRRSFDGRAKVATSAADVSVRAEIEGAIDEVTRELGPIDALVNNAGVGLYGPVATLDPCDAERLMKVNYLGTLYATKAVLPMMMQRRFGHIVNVASIAGRLGNPFEAAYSASKFAVVGFTEALAVEMAPFGVEISMVCPGPVDTGFFAARGHPYELRHPRPLPVQQVAAAVIDALQHGGLERNLPRAFRFAMAARTLSPRLYLSGTRQTFRRELAHLAAQVAHQLSERAPAH